MIIFMHEDEDIARTNACPVFKIPRDSGIKRCFHCITSTTPHGDFNNNKVVRSCDSIERPAEKEILWFVILNQIEQLVCWHADAFDQCVMNTKYDGFFDIL